ncbi:uncharacterized protein [Anoplolepis gracilipes]|uniref:uncharacterized protein n=1 Tax=Anoplolepis gracilipes TaxID=354296 RepID=UPI003B9F4262
MKGIYLIAIAFLASLTAASVSIINESTFEEEDECPAVDRCPPKLIAHEKDCGLYYECKNRRKVKKECKKGLHFSKKWHGCVDPDKSECNPNPSCKNNELLPHECQCDKFYECKNERKVLRECQVGEIFDKSRQTCIPGKDCEPFSGPDCENNGRLISHECTCTKYYVCKEGQKALRECVKGWHFDSALLECVKGDCPGDCRHGEKKKHECNCELYYTCKNKEWVLEECKKGQHFDSKQSKCMDKDKADCGPPPSPSTTSTTTTSTTTTSTTTTTTPPPPVPGTCPDDVPTKWRHECDCRLYYECNANNKKELQTCAWGKYFDYTNQVCDIAKKVSSKCKNNWDNWL